MNLQFYLEKLQSSDIFKEFIKENPTAFLCSGFFVIDKEINNNQTHFDFYIPEKNQMFSFKMEEKIEKIPVEIIVETPEKIQEDFDFSFDEIEKIIVKKIIDEKVSNKVQRILLSLQRKNNQDFLIGSIFVSAMAMIKVEIDLAEMKIISFEKKSFFDMIKIVKNRDG
ncbi:MAG: hypothetical protein Q7S06_03245 [Nanoarchaeota archaeon]|nr:hypothetical protein [Nanoarchaeota archaeon]